MAGAGYDISLAMSDSKSATSGVTAPFSITGGGGSSLSSLIRQSGQGSTANADQTPAVTSKWITYAIIGAVLLAAIFLWRRFAK